MSTGDRTMTDNATRSRMTEGARILADAGVSTTALAYTAGVSASSVSHWLRGFRAAPPRFFSAVEILGGPQVADQLRKIVREAPSA